MRAPKDFQWHQPRRANGLGYYVDSSYEESIPDEHLGIEPDIVINFTREGGLGVYDGYKPFSVQYEDGTGYTEGDTRVLVEEVYPGEEHEGISVQILASTKEGPMWIEKIPAHEYIFLLWGRLPKTL